jgi:hypothetical protein
MLFCFFDGKENKETGTGKSMSEDLILESVNPQYDKRLFIDFQEKYIVFLFLF